MARLAAPPLLTGGAVSLRPWILEDAASLEPAHIDVEPGNEASRRVAESLGAKQSDTVRRELDGSS